MLRERHSVHSLLNLPLFVDDPCVVGDEEIEKLLTLLISFQTVDRETLVAVIIEVAPAPCCEITARHRWQRWSGASAHVDRREPNR